MKFSCTICNREFLTRSGLLKHERAAHPAWFHSKPNINILREEKKHMCEVCKKTFFRPSHLLKHKQTVHEIHEHKSNKESDNGIKHQCHICNKTFSKNSNLKQHLKIVHKIAMEDKKCLKCSQCLLTFTNKVILLDHIRQFHDISTNEEKLHFTTAEEFNKWKMVIERNSSSKFIVNSSYKLSAGSETKNYTCHRNGKYVNKSIGKRHTKIAGTNKTEYFCPANIFIKSETALSLFPANITYCSTHLGHSCELGRLPLSKEEKDELAGQLLSGVPMQSVLCKISDSASPTKRLSYTNMQDLRNISASYGLTNHTVRNVDDVASVDSWVQQMFSSDTNPIVLYKLPGENQKLPELETGDFVLGFMNEAQEEIFKTYGSDIISIDSTHGTNKYNIQLTSIMVKDNNYEGFPVAFLWSNRQTENLFKYFFQSLKERIGEINPQTFMSDDYPAFYNAWKTVFGQVKYNIICDWHVKRAFSKNACTITNIEKRKQVLSDIYKIMGETNENNFKSQMYEKMEKLAGDTETKKFHAYLAKNYLTRCDQWAACYRTGANINTNMAVERWHRELKYNSDLKGKCGGRLDKAIHSLMKSLRMKLLDRVVTLTRGKITNKLVSLRKAHLLACERLGDTDISSGENFWIVPSFTKDGETYKVHNINISHNCNLVCVSCDACLHQYRCSCPESSIKYNFCKHIHFVCQKLKPSAENKELSEASQKELSIDMQSVEAENEKISIMKELKRNIHKDYQTEARNAVFGFLGKLEKFTSKEQCTEIIKTITELTYKCEAMEKHNSNINLPIQHPIQPNTKMIPQRKFPAKKKSQKNKE